MSSLGRTMGVVGAVIVVLATLAWASWATSEAAPEAGARSPDLSQPSLLAMAKHPLDGQNAPALELKTLDGKDYKLADDKTQVIVLDFWATWCPPCRRSLPGLEDLHEWIKANKKDAAVYAVNVRENADVVRQYWADQKFTLPVLMDADGKAAQAYHVRGIPQTVVIRSGKVVFVQVGYSEDLEQKLKAEIEKAAPPGEKS